MTAVVVAVLVAVGTSGCLDSGGGPHDQWENTDAYVGPEVGSTTGDGGVSCGDAPSFAEPQQLSQGGQPDGGAVHVQFGVAMAAGTPGARHVVWGDRDLGAPFTADLKVTVVPNGSYAGTITKLTRPTGCDLLVQPAVAVSSAGTVLLAATCISGNEKAPTETKILLFRREDGTPNFADPVTLTDCSAVDSQCELPALVATTAGAVYAAWSRTDMSSGTATGSHAMILRSDDDGLTLAAEATLPAAFAASAEPRLAVDPDDGVHLAFTGAFTYGGTSYVGYAKLDTTGAFGTPEVLGSGSSPRLAASADGVYVIWVGASAAVQEAHDTGAGFSSPRALSQPTGVTGVLSPSVATDPGGWAHVFWLAEASDGWWALYAVSKDLGDTWQGPLKISGPFNGDLDGTVIPVHQIGGVDLVADSKDVTLGWGDTASADTMSGITNVYLSRRLCP